MTGRRVALFFAAATAEGNEHEVNNNIIPTITRSPAMLASIIYRMWPTMLLTMVCAMAAAGGKEKRCWSGAAGRPTAQESRNTTDSWWNITFGVNAMWSLGRLAQKFIAGVEAIRTLMCWFERRINYILYMCVCISTHTQNSQKRDWKNNFKLKFLIMSISSPPYG